MSNYEYPERLFVSIKGPNAQATIDSEITSFGALRILIERYRQIDQIGYSPEVDLSNYSTASSELLEAADCYMFSNCYENDGIPEEWPWEDDDYKGGIDRIQDLVRAGALIAAEIDRLLLEVESAQNPKGQPPSPDLQVSLGVPILTLELPGIPDPDTREKAGNIIPPGTGSDPATWFGGLDKDGAPDSGTV